MSIATVLLGTQIRTITMFSSDLNIWHCRGAIKTTKAVCFIL